MMADDLSNIELDLIANPQAGAPRVRARVDGIRLQWRQRSSDRNNHVGGAGWVCEEHGANVQCWHADDVEDVLAEPLLNRMRKYEQKSVHYR